MVVGPLISAGANLIGGLLNQNQRENELAQQQRIAEQNIAFQKQFAQDAISWKVEDAKRAGIHPLFALGAQTTSFSPVSVGSSSAGTLGDSIASMGQDLGRAATALGDRETRRLQFMGITLDLERKQLENDVLRAELGSRVAKIAQPGNPPGVGFPPSVSDPKVETEEMTNQARLLGKTLENDPFTSDAQTLEDIGGEGVGDVAGPLFKLPSMAVHNAMLNLLSGRPEALRSYRNWVIQNFTMRGRAGSAPLKGSIGFDRVPLPRMRGR